MIAADVVIAGGGPAGLASAIDAARAGMSTLVVEPHAGVIDKACGEGIMPAGVARLAALGIEPEGMPIAGIRYCDATDADRIATGSFHAAPALGVRRTTLHARLGERARELGVRFHHGRVTSFEARPGGVRVAIDGAAVEARWLIGADGLHSRIRRGVDAGNLVARHERSARLGMRRHVCMAPWTDRVEVHLATGAEAYVTPVSPDLVGIALLFDRADPDLPACAMRPADRFDLLLARFPILSQRLRGRTFATMVRGSGPFEQRVSRRVEGSVLLVGDAAGYLDPLTGEGVALALATSEAAIAAIVAGAAETYEDRYRLLTWKHFAVTRALLAVVRHPTLHRPLLGAARIVPRAFDAALDLLGGASSTPLAEAG